MFHGQNISIYIYILGVAVGGCVHGPPYIFCLLLKKWKKQKSMTYTKIKIYIVQISFIFLELIKKLRKGAPNLKERGARSRCSRANMSRVASCGTPTTVWTISLPLRKEGTRCQKYLLFFIMHFPTLTFSYFKSLLLLEFSSQNGEIN